MTCNSTHDTGNPANNFGALGCPAFGDMKGQCKSCPLLPSRDCVKANGDKRWEMLWMPQCHLVDLFLRSR